MPDGSERIASMRKQDQEYVKMFRAWSASKDNRYGFYHASVASENEYSVTDGFKGMYPAADEREVLIRTTKLVAQTMLLFTALNLFGSCFFSGIPHSVGGMRICREGFFIGEGIMPTAASYLFNLVTRLVPILYLIFKTNAGIGIMVPLKISNKPLFRHAVFFAFIAFGVLYLIQDLEYSLLGWGKPWKDLLLLDTTQKRYAVLILYGVMIPVFSEIVHRGVFLSIFRQYGDGFAMMMSSVLAALVSSEGNVLFTFAYSLMLSYFVLSTGSVITSLVMRLIISNSYFGITLFRLLHPDSFPIVSMSVIIIYIGVGMIATIRFVARYSKRISMPIYNLYLTDSDKVMTMFTSPSIIVWLTLHILYMMGKTFI
ncbi:MAG: CPBP family intramembrane metalloprotease [Oscillospiraceae bacterium]|nr:CPBP family intramembrane metalloprotease [Oscillospiraceae bacterium]